jgi:shikimate kinase
MKSITLTGMPGSGKTSAGMKLAEILNMEFFDTDAYIIEHYDKIENLFKIGEDYFRDIEEKAVLACKDRTNAVISTGGGIVERAVNMQRLMESTTVIFIDRPIEDIMADINAESRPLLKKDPMKIYDLYIKRYDKYVNWSHYAIKNSGSIDELVERILSVL